MNTAVATILLVAGLLILWKSADLLVAGAVTLAERLGVSSLVIGLTVVAMGTSAPELAASIAGVMRKAGGGDFAVGNVFGSNIANLALVGGLVALIRPLEVKRKTLYREIPVMLAVALLLWPFLHDAYLSRPEGLTLLAVFTVLILFMVHTAKQEARQTSIEAKHIHRDMNQQPPHTIKNVLFVIVGLVGLALGAEMAVDGAVFIGKRIGLSNAVIAITIIAFGTSLPELVTCVVAAVKGHHDISVGNLVGSNIFNTLLVTGAAAVVRPFDIESPRLAGGTDYWIMVAVSGVFAATVLIGRCVVGRTSGVLLVCTYVGYVLYLLFA
ncbi:MAG: calcium/sodium antiporter [Sedimentisphaerales bacterium]|jgi:cation:H+ antiporter